jgi:hypothetical protein
MGIKFIDVNWCEATSREHSFDSHGSLDWEACSIYRLYKFQRRVLIPECTWTNTGTHLKSNLRQLYKLIHLLAASRNECSLTWIENTPAQLALLSRRMVPRAMPWRLHSKGWFRHRRHWIRQAYKSVAAATVGLCPIIVTHCNVARYKQRHWLQTCRIVRQLSIHLRFKSKCRIMLHSDSLYNVYNLSTILNVEE